MKVFGTIEDQGDDKDGETPAFATDEGMDEEKDNESFASSNDLIIVEDVDPDTDSDVSRVPLAPIPSSSEEPTRLLKDDCGEVPLFTQSMDSGLVSMGSSPKAQYNSKNVVSSSCIGMAKTSSSKLTVLTQSLDFEMLEKQLDYLRNDRQKLMDESRHALEHHSSTNHDLRHMMKTYKGEAEACRKDVLLKERSLQMALTQLTTAKEDSKRLNYELSKLRRKHSQEIQVERDKILHSTHHSSYEELQLTKAQLDATRDMLMKEQEHRHREHLQYETDMDLERRKCNDLELTIDTLTNDLERSKARAIDFEKKYMEREDLIQRAEQERDVLLRELNDSRAKEDQLRMALIDSRGNSDSTYKSLLSSEQRSRKANSQLRKHCQKLMTHLSEIQAALSVQNTHHSHKSQVSQEREDNLQQRLDILVEENQQLHETSLLDTSAILDTSIDKLDKGEWLSDHDMEAVIHSLQEELEHAKAVEEDLLNTLEETTNEVLYLKAQLQQTTEEAAAKERSAYEEMVQTSKHIEKMDMSLARLGQENKRLMKVSNSSVTTSTPSPSQKQSNFPEESQETTSVTDAVMVESLKAEVARLSVALASSSSSQNYSENELSYPVANVHDLHMNEYGKDDNLYVSPSQSPSPSPVEFISMEKDDIRAPSPSLMELVNANSRSVHALEEMVGRMRTRSVSFTSDGNDDEFTWSEDSDAIHEKEHSSSSTVPAALRMLPPQRLYPEQQKSQTSQQQRLMQKSIQEDQQRPSSMESIHIHAPCNVIINGLKSEVSKCHAIIKELQCKLDIKNNRISEANDFDGNDDTNTEDNALEFENIELRRLLSQAEFRSQALQKQLDDVPQDVTIAMAEKRVLETKLMHALGGGGVSAHNNSKENANNKELLKEYKLTIHQLSLALQQIKTQQLRQNESTITTGKRDDNSKVNGDSVDTNEIEKENIEKNENSTDQESEAAGVNSTKQTKKSTNVKDDDVNSREKTGKGSTRDRASVKPTVTKPKKRTTTTTASSSALEGMQKRSMRGTNIIREADTLPTSENKGRRDTRVNKSKAASSSASTNRR